MPAQASRAGGKVSSPSTRGAGVPGQPSRVAGVQKDSNGLNNGRVSRCVSIRTSPRPPSTEKSGVGRLVGDMCGGGTPGPISNPAVKPASADGSMRATACESRSLPTSSPPPHLFSFSPHFTFSLILSSTILHSHLLNLPLQNRFFLFSTGKLILFN